MRRKGLEKFLRKVARHPVLGCTRFLKVFLTDEDTKSDKVDTCIKNVVCSFCKSFLFAGVEDRQAFESLQPEY